MTDNKNNDEEKKLEDLNYPSSEDILNQPGAIRVDVDVEDLSRSNTHTSSALPGKSVKTPAADELFPALGDMDDDEKVSPASDADVTPEDIIALGGQDADLGRREELAVTGDDLDVPGSEEDDSNEEIGEEDEENNYYSLGGDAHEDLEEDKG